MGLPADESRNDVTHGHEMVASVLRVLDLAMWTANLQSGAFRGDAAWLNTHGYRVPTSIEECEQLLHPSDVEKWRAAFRTSWWDPSSPHELSVRFRNNCGAEHHVLQRSAAVTLGTNGRPLVVAGTWSISLAGDDRHPASQDSDSRLRALLGATADGVVLMDYSTMVDANRAAQVLLGRSRRELVGVAFADVSPVRQPDGSLSAVRGTQYMDAAFRGGGTCFDWVFLRPDGATFEAEVTLHALVWAGTRVLQMIIRDVSERHLVEMAYRRSLELLDDTGQLAGVGAWEWDVASQRLRWTPQVYRILDLDRDYVPTWESLTGFCVPDARGPIREALAAALADGTPFDLEMPWSTALDRRVWVRMVGHADRSGPRTTRLAGALHDVTERRRGEELRALQGAALNATGDAVAISAVDGAVEWVNPALCRMANLSHEHAQAAHLGVLLDPSLATRPETHECWRTVRAGHTWQGVLTRRGESGVRTIEQVVWPMLEAGVVTHCIAVQKDVTERLQLEAQYRQAQKMESVGHLASGIAHDFNNLLTVINGLSDLLLKQIDETHPMALDLEDIRRAGERAASLTRQLLAFSRQQILMPQQLCLNDVVTGMEDLLRRLLGTEIALIVNPQLGLPRILADPGQLEQVIVNLVVNAKDAMPHGGQLTIETQSVELDKAYGRQHGIGLDPGTYVALAVSDTGEGMDAQTRARVFEPFFTTKPPGKGTGLGLSMVYGIVKQSRGWVWVYSEPGIGTTFKIYLPCSMAQRVSASLPAPAPARHAEGSEVILLVEDNGGLRNLATRLLEPAGYTVLAAASGEEALQQLESDAQRVDLLLTDVVMPGMSGRELAERLTQKHPHLRVLYMSGYTSDSAVRHGILDANVAFLSKPFTAGGLRSKVREVLDAGRRDTGGRVAEHRTADGATVASAINVSDARDARGLREGTP